MDIIMAVLILLVVILIFVIFIGFREENNVFKRYYYFDANATTPMHKDALTEYTRNAYLGNASAGYSEKMGIDKKIETVTNTVKRWLSIPSAQNEKQKGCGYRVIFNSCASEGNNYIIKCLSDSFLSKNTGILPHFVISSLEHKTSIDCIKSLKLMKRAEVTFVDPCDASRTIRAEDVLLAIKPNTVLISVMHANNETGNLNPIREIGKIAREHGIFFHSDVVQSIGKYPVPMQECGLDAITASMHKIYGPVGVGILVLSPKLREYLSDCAVAQIAGSQFDGMRGGTINIAGILASGKAMEITFRDREQKNRRLSELKELLKRELLKRFTEESFGKFYMKDDKYTGDDLPGKMKIVFITGGSSLPNTLMFSIIRLGKYDINNEDQRFCNVKLKKALFERGFIISIGSACNTKLKGASHVLKAIGAPFLIRSGTVRVSMIDHTTAEDVKKLVEAIIGAAEDQIRKF